MNPLKKQNSFEQKLKEQLDGMEFKPSDALWNRIEQNINTDSFEPALRSKLENFSVDPFPETWEKVEAQLPDTKKRRAIIYYSLITSLLAITFTAGYYLSYHKNNDSRIATLKDQPAEARISDSNSKSAQPSDMNSESLPANSPAQTSSKMSLHNERSARLPVPNQSAKSIIQTETNTGTTNPNSANPARQSSNQASAKQSMNPTVVSSNPNQSGRNINPSRSTQNSNGPDKLSQHTAGSNVQPKVAADANTNSSSNSANAQPQSTQGVTSAQGKPQTPPKIDLGTIEIKGSDATSIKPINQKDSSGETQTASKGNYAGLLPGETSSLSIVASAGANISFMHLTMPDNNAYNIQKSFDLRKKIEKPSVAFNAGFYLNYQITKKWSIGSGVGILTSKQNVNYSTTQPTGTYTKVGDPNLYINSTDSIISGSSKSLDNNYSFTEIPVWIGYRIHEGEFWNFDLNAGGSYGRLNLVDISIPDPSCVGMLIANDRESFPKFKNVWFASFMPSAEVKFSPTVSFGAIPYLKVSLTNMVNNTNWIGQYPIMSGLNFYIRKKI